MDSLGYSPGLRDERERVGNANGESSALGRWVYCDIFNLECDREKNIRICDHNELVIADSMRQLSGSVWCTKWNSGGRWEGDTNRMPRGG